jgi:MFS family permease
MVAKGRRTLIIIACLVGITGSAINLVFNIYALIGGRLIFGIGSGFLTVAGPRFMEEYIPPQTYSTMGPIFVSCMPLGSFIAVLGGLLLPPDTSSE